MPVDALGMVCATCTEIPPDDCALDILGLLLPPEVGDPALVDVTKMVLARDLSSAVETLAMTDDDLRQQVADDGNTTADSGSQYRNPRSVHGQIVSRSHAARVISESRVSQLPDAKERLIQQHLYDHLWLLDTC